MPDERRRYPRVPAHLNVLLLRTGLRPRGCRVLDISPGGLFLECAASRGPQHADEPPPPENGETVEVRLLLRDGETPEHFTLGGRVTHLSPSGLGVLFDQPQPVLMGRQMDSISASLGGLRSGAERPSTPTPAPAAVVETGPASATATAPAADEPRASEPAPVAGPWQINLITLGNRKAAAAFAERARTQGVPAEPMPVTRAGQTLWRVSGPGFPNAEAASAKARDYQERLDLEGAWVSRR